MKPSSGWAPGVLANIGWRYMVYHRWQSLLMVLGVALGVAVVVAIDLANASASRSFELSTETVVGKTTHQIQGGAQGIPEGIYVDMRRQGIVDLAAPVISEYVTSPEFGSKPMQLLGIDPFADAPFRSFLGQAASEDVPDLAGLSAFLVRPGAVLISDTLASRSQLEPGDRIELNVGGYRRDAYIAGVLTTADELSRRTLDGVILADISTAQELTGMNGLLSRIDLIFTDEDSSRLQRLRGWLPAEYQLVSAESRTGAIEQMTAAFKLNLSMLSMLALVVGLFLIYNTMTFSVVQRRGLFGTLRCLGVTRREIFFLVTSEAFLVGLIGGAFGIGLGVAMGQVTVGMVSQTVNDLYFTTTVRSVGIAGESLVKGGLMGLLATVLAAAVPAWEAASVPPRAALLRSGLEMKAQRSVGITAAAGILSGGLGILFFILPTTSLIVGFTGTLLVVVGFALLSSIVLVVLMRLIGPISGRALGFIGRMAPRNLVNALSRTSVAVAALMVAVAVTIGVGLMINSFRGTVVVWLEETLQGDVYLTVPGFNATRSTVAIAPGVVAQVLAWPGVARVDTLRSVTVEANQGPVNLSATENPDLGMERQYKHLLVRKEDVWQEMQAGKIIVSEPLANRFGLKQAGEALTIDTPSGKRSFEVLGIYYDYASSEGTVMMAMDVYQDAWKDSALTALGLRLEPGVDPDRLAVDLQDRLQGDQQLLIRPNRALREDVLEVFDRTFAITVALRILATVVAFIGVLNALLLLQLEKQREVGILRALGLTGAQLWRLVMIETGLMGLAAGMLAMPAGYALALILVYVINRRSFGWTLNMSVQPEIFIQALLVALIAALLAGLYPALKMGRMAAAEVIRNE